MTPNEQMIGLRSSHIDADIGLMSVHVSGRLNGLVAQIKIRQVYKNWSDTNIECIYTFPLAWQSVLLGMQVDLNGKKLKGAVKPNKIAEQQYEKAIVEGDLPVMLERAGKDLYTANIGNIQPGDEVVIEFDYAQILKSELGTIRFNLPTTIAPRYGDASKHRMKLHQQSVPDPQAEHRLFVELDLAKSLCSGKIYSPTHEIQQTKEVDKYFIKLDGLAWLDRDFVLCIDQIENMNFAVASQDPVHLGQATIMTGNIFQAQNIKNSHPCTIKVLVDCSGSMHGDSIEQAKDCLDWLFSQLTRSDKVSFTRFGSSVHHEHPTLQLCSDAYKKELKITTRMLDANLAGTQLENALEEVIALKACDQKNSEDAIILLITDGEVWDIENIIATVRASGHRIYAVGVGASPAESLLKDMAEVTGGACEIVTPRESMQLAVERLLYRLRKTQNIEHEVISSAPVLWQSKPALYAVQGESLVAWTQVRAQGTKFESLHVGHKNYAQDAPIERSVEWDSNIELSRIAVAFRLHDIAELEVRESLALEYQLVTSETNLILVHERAEAEKANELPELHQVRPMLAAGWGGNGSVMYSVNIPSAQLRRSSKQHEQMLRMPSDTSPFSNIFMETIDYPSGMKFGMDKSISHESENKVKMAFHSILKEEKKYLENKNKKSAPEDLVKLLRNISDPKNPLIIFVNSFNNAALARSQFRSALVVCLRSNSINYIEWLVIKHMQAAGSAAHVWAIFISWIVSEYSLHLNSHARDILSNFINSNKIICYDDIVSDLNLLKF